MARLRLNKQEKSYMSHIFQKIDTFDSCLIFMQVLICNLDKSDALNILDKLDKIDKPDLLDILEILESLDLPKTLNKLDRLDALYLLKMLIEVYQHDTRYNLNKIDRLRKAKYSVIFKHFNKKKGKRKKPHYLLRVLDNITYFLYKNHKRIYNKAPDGRNPAPIPTNKQIKKGGKK